MMTGEQYRASLDDGRATYFEGERVDDLLGHPILGPAANVVAAAYDRFYEPGAARNPMMEIPRSAQDLRDHIPLLHQADLVANTTYQSIMTLMTVAGRIGNQHPVYAERIQAFVERAQRDDIRIAECITDAKGDRGLPPGKQADPDSYTRVVERRDDGVVIRGAKLHISGARSPRIDDDPDQGDEGRRGRLRHRLRRAGQRAGVKVVNASYAPRHEDLRTFPISGTKHCPEGFVIFDDVFVPNERIFLDGEVEHAAVFAHSLGLWERLGGLAFMADEADELVGFAQLIAEANGLARTAHIREKISEMIIHATLVRATLEAAIANCDFGPDGAAYPDELYTNAGKYQGARQLQPDGPPPARYCRRLDPDRAVHRRHGKTTRSGPWSANTWPAPTGSTANTACGCSTPSAT